MKRKKIIRLLIAPLLIMSIMTATLYCNYWSAYAFGPAEVAALDWLVQSLGQLGYGFTSNESANEASKSFSHYVQDTLSDFVNETAPAMVDIAVDVLEDNIDLNICVSQADMQMWNGVFNKNQTLAESKFQTLGLHELSMDSVASGNRVATGSYSALSVLTRGWLTRLVKDGHAPSWLDTEVGKELAVKVPVKLEETAFYKYVTSDMFYEKLHEWSSDNNENDIRSAVNTFLTNADAQDIADLGSKIFIGYSNRTKTIYYNDVPDSTAKLRLTYMSYSDFYIIEYIDSLGNVLSHSTPEYVPFSNYAIRDLNYYANSNSRYVVYYLPFGFSSSSARNDYIPIDNLSGKTLAVSDIDIDNLGFDINVTPISSTSFGMTRTGTTENADTMDLSVPDTAVHPAVAEKVIDKTSTGDYAGVTTITDSAVDTNVSNPVIDVPVAVPEAGGYTLSLVDFFPFCIPFDIYKLLACLAADPVAPSIHYEFPLLGETYSIDADLSVFDSVAKVMRTMETLAFCVGLGILTNKLIKH